MDALAWRVDARGGECGFSPHRDRQPDDCGASFRSDGTARYATCWIALSEATPESGCLYVIPRDQDPGYTAGAPPLVCVRMMPDGARRMWRPFVIGMR